MPVNCQLPQRCGLKSPWPLSYLSTHCTVVKGTEKVLKDYAERWGPTLDTIISLQIIIVHYLRWKMPLKDMPLCSGTTTGSTLSQLVSNWPNNGITSFLHLSLDVDQQFSNWGHGGHRVVGTNYQKHRHPHFEFSGGGDQIFWKPLSLQELNNDF